MRLTLRTKDLYPIISCFNINGLHFFGDYKTCFQLVAFRMTIVKMLKNLFCKIPVLAHCISCSELYVDRVLTSCCVALKGRTFHEKISISSFLLRYRITRTLNFISHFSKNLSFWGRHCFTLDRTLLAGFLLSFYNGLPGGKNCQSKRKVFMPKKVQDF